MCDCVYEYCRCIACCFVLCRSAAVSVHGRSVFALYKGDTVQPRQRVRSGRSVLLHLTMACVMPCHHGWQRAHGEEVTTAVALEGPSAHTGPHGHGPAPSRSVTCPLLRPSTCRALMAERVTTCSCTHRHGRSVLVLQLCRRDHARRCLCVPAIALRRLCRCRGVTPTPIDFWSCHVTGEGHLTASLPISCEAAPSWGEPSLRRQSLGLNRERTYGRRRQLI